MKKPPDMHSASCLRLLLSLESDDLAPARGLIIGLAISMAIWAFIALAL